MSRGLSYGYHVAFRGCLLAVYDDVNGGPSRFDILVYVEKSCLNHLCILWNFE